MTHRNTVEASFYIECEECGYDLEARVQAETIIVTPCKRCMEGKVAEGFKEGADRMLGEFEEGEKWMADDFEKWLANQKP